VPESFILLTDIVTYVHELCLLELWPSLNCKWRLAGNGNVWSLLSCCSSFSIINRTASCFTAMSFLFQCVS